MHVLNLITPLDAATPSSVLNPVRDLDRASRTRFARIAALGYNHF